LLCKRSCGAGGTDEPGDAGVPREAGDGDDDADTDSVGVPAHDWDGVPSAIGARPPAPARDSGPAVAAAELGRATTTGGGGGRTGGVPGGAGETNRRWKGRRPTSAADAVASTTAAVGAASLLVGAPTEGCLSSRWRWWWACRALALAAVARASNASCSLAPPESPARTKAPVVGSIAPSATTRPLTPPSAGGARAAGASLGWLAAAAAARCSRAAASGDVTGTASRLAPAGRRGAPASAIAPGASGRRWLPREGAGGREARAAGEVDEAVVAAEGAGESVRRYTRRGGAVGALAAGARAAGRGAEAAGGVTGGGAGDVPTSTVEVVGACVSMWDQRKREEKAALGALLQPVVVACPYLRVPRALHVADGR